jgi:hypothetical protein
MNKKNSLYYLLGALAIITIVLYIFLPQVTKKTTTTPILPSVKSQFPTPHSKGTYKQPTLMIDWSQVSTINPDDKYPLYISSFLLSDKLAEDVAGKLGLTSQNKQTLNQNVLIWKTSEQILLYAPKEQTLNYENLKKPQTGNIFQSSEVGEKALAIVEQILPKQTFRVASITYFKDNLYSNPTSAEAGEIAQVYLDQLVNGYPVVPSNLTQPHTIILYLYRDLSVKTLTIINGYLESNISQNSQQFNLEELKNLSLDFFIKITPLKVDKQGIFDLGSVVLFTVKKVEPAYIQINNSLSPVYLISGNIKIDDLTPFSENVYYVAPMNY